ncbi:MAG: radical SAM protein [Candidatus Thorarchaeota archaeon]
MIVEEYDAKTIIRSSKTSLFTWSEAYLNPYQGCYHDCKYCDGKSEGYYMHDDFGERVKVKRNTPYLLEQYLKKQNFFPINREKTSTLIDYFPNLKNLAASKTPGKPILFIGGGVCDVYQPVEKEVKMTRRLLQIAHDYKMPVSFLTKNNLILRDIDLLKKINEDSYASASFSITLADEKTQKIFEPRASTTQERFDAIKILRDEGVHSGVYFYPTLPFIGDTDENMKSIYKQASEVGAEFVYCWGLTLKPGRNKIEFMNTINENFSDLLPKYTKLYGNEDKYGNLDSEVFNEYGLIWPEIKGYKLGYELGLDYTAKRYVPEGRISFNIKITEILYRIAYLKSFFVKSSKYEINRINQASVIINSTKKDVSKMDEKDLMRIGIDKIVFEYIFEFTEKNESTHLKILETEAYDSVCKYLESKEQN